MQPVRCGILQNGMRFYTHERFPQVVSGIGVKHGSIHDPPNKRGRAHLLEHVISSRTRTLTDWEVDLHFWKYMGGYDEDRKIQIDRVATFYGHDLLLSKRDMLQCFPIFAEMLRDPVLDPEDILSEMGAVRQEYFLRGVDWLPVCIDDLMHESMYERNPARNRVDCDPEELKTITRDDLYQCCRDYYVANNMFGVFLGISQHEARRIMRKHFDDFPEGQIPALPYDGGENFPLRSSMKSVEIPRSGIHQIHFALGFPTGTYKMRGAEALDVLAQILNFRLYRLRKESRDPEKGIYRIEVFTPRSLIHGMIYIYFASSSKECVEWGREKILEEIERLKRERVSSLEFHTMVGRLDRKHRNAFTVSSEKLADLIIEAVSNGDEQLRHLNSFQRRLHKTTRNEVLTMANKYFTPNFVQVSLLPD